MPRGNQGTRDPGPVTQTRFLLIAIGPFNETTNPLFGGGLACFVLGWFVDPGLMTA